MHFFSLPATPGLNKVIQHYCTLSDGLPVRLSRGIAPELPRGKPSDGNGKLHGACLSGDISAVRKHLNAAEANKYNKWQRSPLHEACRAGQEEVVSLLLDNAAACRLDLDVKDYRVRPWCKETGRPCDQPPFACLLFPLTTPLPLKPHVTELDAAAYCCCWRICPHRQRADHCRRQRSREKCRQGRGAKPPIFRAPSQSRPPLFSLHILVSHSHSFCIAHH